MKIFGKALNIVPGVLTYNRDGLATKHNADFMKEPRFVDAYAAARSTGSWADADIEWRAHVIAWAAGIGSKLEGDFVECGVNRGGTAMMAMRHADLPALGKTFYLLDTYEGLVEGLVTDAETEGLARYKSLYLPVYDAVVETFEPYPCARVIRGPVPDTLSKVDTDRIAYLSIDMNCLAPEIAAGEFFWPKMSVGAPIVLDDYGWDGHIEQKRGWDDFASRHGVSVLSLPTGQGLIVKR